MQWQQPNQRPPTPSNLQPRLSHCNRAEAADQNGLGQAERTCDKLSNSNQDEINKPAKHSG